MPGPEAELARMVRAGKTTAPQLDPRLMRRPELIGRLREAKARLVTVTAPAGYGKTSLLIEWREQESRDTGWVTLDKSDDDPVVLMTLMATASAPFAPGAAAIRDALEAGEAGVLAHIAPALALALSRSARPFVLFLDDLHVIHSDDCLDAIDIVLSGVPEGSQVVWASRHRFDGIARGRLRASEVSVAAEDLRLDVQGAAEIASAVGVKADAETLNDWVERCSGWAAGIHMCALLSRNGTASSGGSDELLADYLYSECVQDLPDDMRDFLLRTSILQTHFPALCDVVADRTDSAAVLRELEARQLFVTADRDRRSYRLHPLFREFLRAELERVASASVPALHLRAAQWFQNQGQLPAAIDNLIAAREFGMASSLVAAAAIHAYEAGQVATLERWLAEIGDANLLATPSTVVVVAWVSILAGTDAAADKWGTLLDTVPGVSGPVDGIELGSAQAMIRAIMMKDGMASALRDAQYAADVEAPGSPWRDPALQILGSTLLHAGEQTRGRKSLDAARHTAEAHSNPATIVMCETEFAFLAIEQEEWGGAEQHVRRALEALASGGIDGYVMAAYAHAAAACVELHGGQAAGPRLLAVAMSERSRCMRAVPLIAIPTRLLLIRAQLLSGDLAAARILLREIEDVLPSGDGRQHLDERVAAARGMIEKREREGRRDEDAVTLTLTIAEQRLLPYLQTHLSRAEIAERLFVSRNTVGTQISAIFRKLGASNRTDAVRRAIELGLLG